MKSMAMILISAAACWIGEASGASIGLFSTPDGSSCTLRIPPAQGAGTLYICASTNQGPSFPGMIDRATFRIEGLPPGWSALSNHAPLTVASGDPFREGAIISPSSPYIWTGFAVLYTVILTPASPGAEAILHVTGGVFLECPSVETPEVMCAYCPFCATGGTMFVNSALDCTVAIQPSTWSQVKSLYE